MATAQPPASHDHDDHVIILVGQNGAGEHVVHGTHGTVDGVFDNRAAALRYAQSASAAIPGSILMITPQLVGCGTR
jgi:hypothetical protein